MSEANVEIGASRSASVSGRRGGSISVAQASGVSLTEAYALVSTLRDGRVIRHQEYFDHAQVLEAVGLRE
jgi:ketosteroid isomerase-like protein